MSKAIILTRFPIFDELCGCVYTIDIKYKATSNTFTWALESCCSTPITTLQKTSFSCFKKKHFKPGFRKLSERLVLTIHPSPGSSASGSARSPRILAMLEGPNRSKPWMKQEETHLSGRLLEICPLTFAFKNPDTVVEVKF